MALKTGTVLKRGFRRRCPVCGQKRLFRRWIVMADECPRCGLVFRRVPGQWLGSWFLNICLAQVLIVGIITVVVAVTYPDPPLGAVLVFGGIATFAFPFLFFPFSRTIWLAIDLAMRPLEFHEGVDPLWELEPATRRALEDEAARAVREAGAAPLPELGDERRGEPG